MAQAKQVKIAIITGYLGAGKTTLLNHILSNSQGIRAAVIVNDIGEVNIDAQLIAQTGAVAQVDDSLIPMTNGCICCTLSEDLADQLEGIAASGSFDYIIIEASGICEPLPIAYTIEAFCQEDGQGTAAGAVPMRLDNVIAVVDCARMLDEFHSGRDLLEGEDDIAQLLVEQIEFCSTLVLNKTDQVSEEDLGEIKAIVRSLQKHARIIEAEHGRVDVAELLDTGRFDFEDVYASSGWASALGGGEDGEDDGQGATDGHGHADGACGHHHHGDGECDDAGCGCHRHHDHEHDHEHDHVAEFGISTFVYERRRPFAADALDAVCESWPSGIIRCKGMAWLSEDPDNCYVFEQAGHRFYLTENGPWLAMEPEDFRNQVMAEDPSLFDDWDDEIGDRRIKLVFICKDLDQAAVESWLDGFLG